MKSKIDNVELTPSEKEDVDISIGEQIRQIDDEIKKRKESSFFHSLKNLDKKKKK